MFYENFKYIIPIKEFKDYVEEVDFLVIICSGYHHEKQNLIFLNSFYILQNKVDFQIINYDSFYL
ncbi:MAG: hypothetical protein WCZ11_00180 [Bacilli bacterium]